MFGGCTLLLHDLPILGWDSFREVPLLVWRKAKGCGCVGTPSGWSAVWRDTPGAISAVLSGKWGQVAAPGAGLLDRQAATD